MVKFIALYEIKSLSVPYIVKDEKGKILVDQTINFQQGLRDNKGVVPAHFSTGDPEILAYLRKYAGNKANGGHSFEEIQEEKAVAKEAAKPAPKKAEAPEPVLAIEKEPLVIFELPDEEDPETEPVIKAGVIPQPEVTTVQMASSVLRALDSKLTIRDTKTKAQVLALAELKNISFPNL